MTSTSLKIKLSLFTGFSVLGSSLAVALAGAWAMDHALQTHFRQTAQDASILMASRIGDEIKAISQRGREYLATGDLKRFESDPDLIALTVMRKGVEWEPVSQWSQTSNNPSHLSATDFKELELKHPVDYDRISNGATDIVLGTVRNQSPFLRIALPWGNKTEQGYLQAMIAEVKAQKILGLFSEAHGFFSFLVGPGSQLLVASESGHFIQAEDLAQLPVLQAARASAISHGELEYSETPAASPQYAGFARVSVGGADLTIVSQAPRSRIDAVLSQFSQLSAILIFAFSFLSAALAWLSIRVNGTESVKTPIHNLTTVNKARLKGAKLTGERMNALVVHAHLHGIEKTLASADPETLLGALNQFNLAVTEAIESNQGFVDRINGGSAVGCWGVPAPQKNDAEQALLACQKIREAATALNNTVQAAGLPPISLGMAMHYGPVVAGQVANAESTAYSVFGEAVELASRIHFYTHQFGTDFLMTSQAAARLSQSHIKEKLTSGDEETPELYELAA